MPQFASLYIYINIYIYIYSCPDYMYYDVHFTFTKSCAFETFATKCIAKRILCTEIPTTFCSLRAPWIWKQRCVHDMLEQPSCEIVYLKPDNGILLKDNQEILSNNLYTFLHKAPHIITRITLTIFPILYHQQCILENKFSVS